MKRNICIFLTLCLLLLLAFPALAAETASAAPAYRMLFLTQNRSAFSAYSADSSAPADFNALSDQDLAALDLVVSSSENVKTLSAASLAAFLSGGGVFCVETTDTTATFEAIYRKLGYSTVPTVNISGAEPVAVFVKLDGNLVNPGIISIGRLSLVNPESLLARYTPVEAPSLVSVDWDNFLYHAFASPIPNGDATVYTASTGYNRQFYNYTTFEKVLGQEVGSCYITQYVYDICTFQDKSGKKIVSDVISHVVVDAASGAYVDSYTVRMGTSASSAYIIDQTYLQSGKTVSTTLSGGFSANTDATVSGSSSKSTSYTYSTDNQQILNDFATNTYNNWTAEPDGNRYGASWVLEPGIRVMNYNPSYYYSTAYTSLQSVRMVIAWSKVYSYPLEVSGTW